MISETADSQGKTAEASNMCEQEASQTNNVMAVCVVRIRSNEFESRPAIELALELKWFQALLETVSWEDPGCLVCFVFLPFAASVAYKRASHACVIHVTCRAHAPSWCCSRMSVSGLLVNPSRCLMLESVISVQAIVSTGKIMAASEWVNV